MAVGSWTNGETVRGTWASSGWASGVMLEAGRALRDATTATYCCQTSLTRPYQLGNLVLGSKV